MKINDLSHCSRPMCFENKVEEYEYSLKGSCFVVRHLGHMYAITAKHVTKHFEPNQVLIPYKLGSEKFLPISNFMIVQTEEEEDSDHKDIMVFEIAEHLLDKDFDSSTVYDLDNPTSNLPKRCKLIIHGFPSELNGVDYDKRHFDFRRFSYSAEYYGKMPFYFVHEMKFNCDCPLSSIDGMSGGPVFWIFNLSPTQAMGGLAGIMLRGTVESKVGYFLDIRIAKELIKLHHMKKTSV